MSKQKDAQKTEKPENVKRERFQRSLKVDLTADEVRDRANRAAHKVASISAKTDEMKAQMKHLKSIIEQEAAELKILSQEVRDESTYRQVECIREYDFVKKMYREFRTDCDPGLLEERPLLPSECQPDLFDEEEKPSAPANDDQTWREVPIWDALGKGLGKRCMDAFEKAGIDTMGKFSDFQAKHGEWWSKELPGVGPETITKICDAAEAFWASR